MKFLSNSLPEIFMQTSQTINEGSVTIEVHLEFKYFAPRTDSFLFDFVCVNEGKNSCLVDYREVIFQNGCKTKRFSILTNAMRGESIVCYLNSKTLLGVYNVHTFIAGERERRLESVDPVKESLKLPPRKRARFDPVPPSMPKKQGMCHHRCKDKISCLHECCKLNLTACQEEDKSMRDNFDSVIKPRVNKLKRKINLGYSSLEKTKGLFDDSDEEPGSLFATALEMLIKENEEREKVKTKRKNK